MYNIGDVVTLNIDKSEGAGEASLYINSGITGMIVNSGSACREGDYSYVVDFGPEGQWNCKHSELTSLNDPFGDDNSGWDSSNEEELQQDITEETAARIYGDESMRPGAEGSDLRFFTDDYPQTKKKENKIISFEDDLVRMTAEAERNGG